MTLQKVWKILLAVLMVLGMLPAVGPTTPIAQAAGMDAVYLNEDFSSTVGFPTGSAPSFTDWSSQGNGTPDRNYWTNITTGGTVTVENRPGSATDRSVKLNRTVSDANSVESTVDFRSQPLSGMVTVEADVMSSSLTGTQVFYIYNAGAPSVSTIVKIQLTGGQIKVNYGGTQTALNNFNLNTSQWYNMKAVINTSTDTYDFYIDGTKWVSGQALAAPSGGTVGEVTFKMGSGGNKGTFYYDNLKISKPVPSATVTGLAFDSVTYNVYAGDVKNTVVSAVYSDNSTQVVTTGNTFASLDPSIASIDAVTGTITARNPGTTQISVTNSIYGTPGTATVVVSPASATAVNDDFNSMTTGSAPTGWTGIITSGAGAVSVKDVPSAADKSLALSVTNGSDAAEAHRTFNGLTGKVAIEAKVMTTGSQFSVAPYIINNNKKTFLKFGLRNGYIGAYNNKTINTVPFVAGQWYTIKIVINTNANTYHLWVDGVQQPIDSADLITPFDASKNNTSITEVYFKADNTGSQANCYVDNLKVYTLPAGSISGINFDNSAYSLYPGDSVNAVVNSLDTDGAITNVTNGSTITSLNPAVATVDAAGKLTAVGIGTAQLSASYTVGQDVYQATSSVTVKPLPALQAPQQLSVGTVRSTSIGLNWNADPNASLYSVYRANVGSGQYSYIGQSQPGVAAYIDNNVNPSTSYDYKVSTVLVTPGKQVIESGQSGKATAVTTAPPTNFPAPAAAYTVYDGFNGDPTNGAPGGWTTDTSGGNVNVQEVPFPADKSVTISKIGTSNAATASRTFTPLNGVVTMEAKVKAMDLTGTKAIPSIYDSQGNLLAAIAFKDSNIVYSNRGTLINVVTVNADKWYIVRAVLDTRAQTYDLYIDGMKKFSAIPFLTPASDVGKLVFGIDQGNKGTIVFDNVKVYSQSTLIGGPPEPVYDVRSYGAVGDGTTMDTAAIQAAVEKAAGTGGSVYLHDGTFLSGMIQLRSNMTLYIDASATLKGSTSAADYPDTHPLTYNTQIGVTSNTNKALVYAENVENVRIDGGGTIDGSGDAFTAPSGTEHTRPIAIYVVMSSNVTEQNIYIKKSGMWTVVNAETDYLTIRNIYLDVRLLSNRDGFDILDDWHVLVEDVTVNTGDDAICIKSGKRRGVQDVIVRNSNITASNTNGLKFGTASYGAFKNVSFVDNMVKGVKYCAMCVESVDGADVSNISFQRIDVQDAGNPFFVILGKRSDRATKDDSAKPGTMSGVTFQDIIGKNLNTTWGSPITGSNMSDGTKYRLHNISFTNVNMTYKGGKTSIPAEPAEYAIGQYPESNIFSDLPAYGYYVRHADNVTFTNVTTDVSPSDARSAMVMNDVRDTLPPSAPNLSVTGKTQTSVTLSWSASSDNTGVAGYALYKNGVAVPDVVQTVDNSVYSATVNGLTAGTTYDFTVKAYDEAGNYSADSNLISVKTVDLSQDADLSNLVIDQGTLSPVFDKNTTNYSAVVGNWAAQMTIIPTLHASDATLKINGTSTVSGATYTALLYTGTTTFSIQVTAQDGTTKTYSLAVIKPSVSSHSDSGTSGSSQTGSADGKDTASAPGVQVSVDKSTGAAKAEIAADALKNILDKAVADSRGIKKVEIQVPQTEGAKAYEPAIPASFVNNASHDQTIVIRTPLAAVQLPGNMLSTLNVPSASSVSIPLQWVDKSSISDAKLKDKIGDRPILDIQLKIDGKLATYNNPEAGVAISIPYKPTPAELNDPDHIIIWYIDGNGHATKVPSGSYDSKTGMVTFRTTHFSTYAVSYEQKTFTDLTDYAWAKQQIEALASKGIINGTSEDAFSPSRSITRGEFLALLVRTLGLTADVNDNFSDVGKDDAYYREIGIARKLGISEGTSDNKVNPLVPISRQDMMVLSARALQLIHTPGSGVSLATFTDQAEIASYAVDSIAAMVQAGLVTGDGSRLNPHGETTRAEAAVLMYRLYHRMY
ncbi:S-layer homology domain-containing protein [Paenibacillus cremeus]|uniref:Uncharacterized protein n=1 Tax=Paenibacillus cremeus TaxID=2163881 RepID=A0A559KI06_9BACL|nr:S-layer homology domain-containing protein [Paenibacillus cremeus]TVY11751.1 hypothetical protein FPZ49_00190 [Paenibacillus cremeus]